MREKERDMELILASGSPRRRELLSLYTTDFTVCVSDFDEAAVTADTPGQLFHQMGRRSGLHRTFVKVTDADGEIGGI